MIFFLQIAIVPDSRSNAPVDYVIVVNGECTIDFPELKNLQAWRGRAPSHISISKPQHRPTVIEQEINGVGNTSNQRITPPNFPSVLKNCLSSLVWSETLMQSHCH